jgi:ATP-dependent RNA helicase RhlE
MSKLPKKRQSLFFSATMPKEIAALADEFLNKPDRVSVAPVATTVERVGQQVLLVDAGAKGATLAALLRDEDFTRTIVFTRTKRGADRVSKSLDQAGIASLAIHGNKSQGQRQAALDAFKSGRARVLVATDIAARGIDVTGVSHVVNFELPDVPESYVHRIGRTARAGREGQAISLVENAERNLLRAIERLTRMEIPSEDRRSPGQRTDVIPAGRPGRGGGGASKGNAGPRGARPQAARPGGHHGAQGAPKGGRPGANPAARPAGNAAHAQSHVPAQRDGERDARPTRLDGPPRRRRFRGQRPQAASAGASA